MSDSKDSSPSDATFGIVAMVKMIVEDHEFQRYLQEDGTLACIAKSLKDLYSIDPRPENPRLYIQALLELPDDHTPDSQSGSEVDTEALFTDTQSILKRMENLVEANDKIENSYKKQSTLRAQEMKPPEEESDGNSQP